MIDDDVADRAVAAGLAIAVVFRSLSHDLGEYEDAFLRAADDWEEWAGAYLMQMSRPRKPRQVESKPRREASPLTVLPGGGAA